VKKLTNTQQNLLIVVFCISLMGWIFIDWIFYNGVVGGSIGVGLFFSIIAYILMRLYNRFKIKQEKWHGTRY